MPVKSPEQGQVLILTALPVHSSNLVKDPYFHEA